MIPHCRIFLSSSHQICDAIASPVVLSREPDSSITRWLRTRHVGGTSRCFLNPKSQHAHPNENQGRIATSQQDGQAHRSNIGCAVILDSFASSVLARIKLTFALVLSDFARNLYKILSSNPSDAPATDQLVDQINQHVKKLHSYTHKPAIAGVSRNPEVDKQGTRLWNICTRLRQECEPTNKRLKRLYLYGRVIAFHLLVAANPRGTGKAQDLICVVKLALKAARDCVGTYGQWPLFCFRYILYVVRRR